jgi:hypothetical protein
MSLSRINEVLGSIHIGSIVSQYFKTFKIKIKKRFIKKKKKKEGENCLKQYKYHFLYGNILYAKIITITMVVNL